ncbi:MAG: Wzz/FepE/Etk N-terminal domain-containing protein [Pseudomonadota bacterium]
MENYQQRHDEEIDLFEIFKKIWDGKILIAGIVSVAAIVAFLVLKLIPSYYRIDVTIDMVAEDQLRAVSPSFLRSSDTQIFSVDEKKKLVEYQVSYPDSKKIYDRVLLQIRSIPLLKSFWEKKFGVIIDLKSGLPLSEEAKAFKKFYSGFFLEPSNTKTPDITARKVSIEYKNSDAGVTLLNEYLNYLNEKVGVEYSKKMEIAYVENLSALDASYNSLNLIEQRKLNDRIVNLQESLKIANSLGIKETPFKELENIQLNLWGSKDYLLGAKSLAQQIEILTARQGKSLAPFSTDLRNMETWRDQMTADLKRLNDLQGRVNYFSVVNAPEATLDPIKPKRALIFIAVVFLAGIFSIFLVLVLSSVKNRKAIAH